MAPAGWGRYVVEAMSVTELNAGDSSRASHVWRVDGPNGAEIYRRSWWTSPEVSAFMLGLNRLFGVDPRDLQATTDTYRFWRDLGVWRVPEALGVTEFQGAQALRLEFIAGDSQQFDDVLLLALESGGSPPLLDWLAQPALFGAPSAVRH